MIITAIYCKSTHEILYSRSTHDFRQSSDESCFIDGGFEYCRIGGDKDNYILLELNGDYLLKHILDTDYVYGTTNAGKYTHGFHGRFIISELSNMSFYSKLIKDFNQVKYVLFPT
jgi:hypothetical protein